MPKKRQEIKIRTEADVIDRLEWAQYCRRKDLKSINECFNEAVLMWLDHVEAVYGLPADPTARQDAPTYKAFVNARGKPR